VREGEHRTLRIALFSDVLKTRRLVGEEKKAEKSDREKDGEEEQRVKKSFTDLLELGGREQEKKRKIISA
jgi:hypothetical protein